jgi:hypothetical protein
VVNWDWGQAVPETKPKRQLPKDYEEKRRKLKKKQKASRKRNRGQFSTTRGK